MKTIKFPFSLVIILLTLFPSLLPGQIKRDSTQRYRIFKQQKTFFLTDTSGQLSSPDLIFGGDTIYLLGEGIGSKDVAGSNFTQHLDWIIDVSFSWKTGTPAQSGHYLVYPLTIIDGRVCDVSYAKETFYGSNTISDDSIVHEYAGFQTGYLYWDTISESTEYITCDLPHSTNPEHFEPYRIKFFAIPDPDSCVVYIANFDIWMFEEDYPLESVWVNDGDDCHNECQTCPCSGEHTSVSYNPISSNVLVSNTPVQLASGKGPDIAFSFDYRTNEQQNDINSPNINYYPAGKGWNFSYASFYVKQGNNVLVVMPSGKRDLYKFNVGGAYSPPSGLNNKLEASGNGYCLTLPGSGLKYYYTASTHNKLTSIVDKGGQTVTLYYDANNNLDYIKDATNRIFQVNVSASGLITSITDPLNRTATLQYDSEGFLTGITSTSNITSTFSYSEAPFSLATTGTYGSRKVMTLYSSGSYNQSIKYENAQGSDGRIGKMVTFSDGENSKSYLWTPVSRKLAINTMTDGRGNVTQYFINRDSSRIDKIVPPDASATIYYHYNSQGFMDRQKIGTYQTTLVYDNIGNVTRITDPRGKVTNMTYNSNNDLVTLTDPMGRVTTCSYDANRNLTGIITPTGTSSFTYNASNKPVSYTDPNNHVTTYSYDANGFLSNIQPPSGTPINLSNDNAGRVISSTTAGVTLTYQYDDLDRITKTTYPDGTTVNKTYDLKNLLSETDRGGRTNSYDYECGTSCNLKSNTGPQGTVHYERDGNGNITKISVNGQVTSYFYDGMDRVIKQVNPDGTYREYTYDLLGNKITRRDENGAVTNYNYNYNLLTNINYPGSTPDVSFTYNNNGEVTSMTDGTGTTTYTYDNGGRLTGKDGPENDDNFTYTYDNVGNRLSMSLPGMSVNYTYDNLNRLTAVSGGTMGSAQYNYDVKSNLIEKAYSNGSTTSYTYDNLNRLTSLQNKHQNGQVFSGFAYTYDDASMITKIVDNEGNVSTYEYDYPYQLTEEKVLTPNGKTLWHNKFIYDVMGNRVTLDKNGILDHYTYNVNNQLLSLTKTSINASGIVLGDSLSSIYVEDIKANAKYIGNNKLEFSVKNIPLNFTSDSLTVIAKVNESFATIGDSSKFISVPNANPTHTVEIRFVTDTTGINQQYKTTIYRVMDTITYTYDANGNLTQRKVGDETTTYSWDAENRLVQITYPDNENEKYIYDGFGQRMIILINDVLQQRYIYDYFFEAIGIKYDNGKQQHLIRGLNLGGGIGGIISLNDNYSGTNFFYYNHKGDLIVFTNNNDSTLGKTIYDAFGKRMNQYENNNSTISFSSKEFNELSDLSYFGHRYYSAEMNQWISKDPIELNGGLNFYSGFNNNPIGLIDPTGLMFVPVLANPLVLVTAATAAVLYFALQNQKAISKTISRINRNSKNSCEPNIIYKIVQVRVLGDYEETVMKFGISGQPNYKTKPGNPRPQIQAKDLNLVAYAFGTPYYYYYEILDNGNTYCREQALERERELVTEYFNKYGKTPPWQWLPLP